MRPKHGKIDDVMLEMLTYFHCIYAHLAQRILNLSYTGGFNLLVLLLAAVFFN